MNDDPLRGAAFHEAGHFIVAREFGLPVGEIEIGDDGSGRSQIGSAVHLRLIDQIALCVAGIEAAADYGMVISPLDGLNEAESLEHRGAACLRALEILQKHRPEVKRLADHLIEHRRARGFDVLQSQTVMLLLPHPGGRFSRSARNVRPTLDWRKADCLGFRFERRFCCYPVAARF